MSIINFKHNNYVDWYKLITTVFLTLSNVYNFMSTTAVIRNNIRPVYYIFMGINVIFLLFYFLFSKLNFKIILTEICITLALMYGYIFKNTSIILVCIYCLILIVLKPIDIIKISGLAFLLNLILFTILSLLGILPLFYSSSFDSGLLLGFTHKNTTGFVILMIILSIVLIDNYKKKKIMILLISFSFIVTFFLVKDRTVAFIIFILLIFYFFMNNQKMKGNCLLFELIPIVLIFLSFYLIKHWSLDSWINVLNNVLSGRIYIWNMEWNLYSLKLFPQSIGIGNYYDVFAKIPLDGFFALGILNYGIILFLIIIFLMVNAIRKIYYYSNNLMLLIFILLISSGFTEMITVTSTCWLLPVSISLFYNKKCLMHNDVYINTRGAN